MLDVLIAKAVNQWLLSTFKVFRVVERLRIPHDLIHDLRHADRMRGGTLVAGKGAAGWRVGHVAAMIGTVEILAVPARREDDGGADPARTHLGWQLRGVARVAWRKPVPVALASVADARESGRLISDGWVAGDHAEALRCQDPSSGFGLSKRTGLKDVVLVLFPPKPGM